MARKIFSASPEALVLTKSPTVLQNLSLPLIMEHHINRVEVSRFFKAISNMLQDQPKQDQSP
jgi:hypothetical protein